MLQEEVDKIMRLCICEKCGAEFKRLQGGGLVEPYDICTACISKAEIEKYGFSTAQAVLGVKA